MTTEEKELRESLKWREKYINENYNGQDKTIALFEVNTLTKIVNKCFGTKINKKSVKTKEKPVRKKKKIKRKVRRKEKTKKSGFFS